MNAFVLGLRYHFNYNIYKVILRENKARVRQKLLSFVAARHNSLSKCTRKGGVHYRRDKSAAKSRTMLSLIDLKKFRVNIIHGIGHTQGPEVEV